MLKPQESGAAGVGSPELLDDANAGLAVSDTRTLAEASRNLTQTLRKLSKEVFTNKIDLSGGGGGGGVGGSGSGSLGVGAAGVGTGSGSGAGAGVGGDETPRKNGSGAVIESMRNHGKGIYSGTFSGTLNPALQDRFGRPKRDISTVIHILNDLLSATPQYSRGARISFEAPASGSSTGSGSSSNSSSSSASSSSSSGSSGRNGIAALTATAAGAGGMHHGARGVKLVSSLSYH